MARRGRRPGVSRAREDILGAARGRFAADGFAGATVRSIAADAGVDSALVHHYFGTKQALFAQAMSLPFDPRELVAAIVDGPPDQTGRRLLQTHLSTWDPAEHRLLMAALLRTSATEDGAARMLREFLVGAIYRPVVDHLGSDQPELRAVLTGSQLVGLAMMRYVIQAEPLASANPDEVVDILAPAIQNSLTGKGDSR